MCKPRVLMFLLLCLLVGLPLYKPCRKSTGKKNPCCNCKTKTDPIVKGPMCEPRVILRLIVGLSLYKPGRKSTGKKNLAIISQNISARRVACWDRPLRERERETLEYQNTSITKLCSPALISIMLLPVLPFSSTVSRDSSYLLELRFPSCQRPNSVNKAPASNPRSATKTKLTFVERRISKTQIAELKPSQAKAFAHTTSRQSRNTPNKGDRKTMSKHSWIKRSAWKQRARMEERGIRANQKSAARMQRKRLN